MSMVIKSEFGIYKVLEKYLKATKEPLTCVDLFEHADIKQYAADTNKVSDYLGHMWRRGLLDRFYAPKTSTSFARYAYTWKDQSTESDKAVPVSVRPRTGTAPQIEVDENDGTVTVTTQEFVLIVKPRK